jgi:adenosylhomocysteine nucleosidase
MRKSGLMIALTAATKEEIDGVGRHIARKERLLHNGLWQGEYGSKKVLLMQTGIGKDRVEQSAYPILESYPLTALISLGFAGALKPELRTGEIVLCTKVHHLDNGQGEATKGAPHSPNEDLLQRAGEVSASCGLSWLNGSSVTIMKPAYHTQEKIKLSKMAQAEVCEMEDYWLAQAAGKKQIPFLAVRVVYDEMQTPLPDFERIVDHDGNLRLRQLIPYFLTHPRYVLNAPVLYRNSHRAKDRLATFVKSFLDRL